MVNSVILRWTVRNEIRSLVMGIRFPSRVIDKHSHSSHSNRKPSVSFERIVSYAVPVEPLRGFSSNKNETLQRSTWISYQKLRNPENWQDRYSLVDTNEAFLARGSRHATHDRQQGSSQRTMARSEAREIFKKNV